ncbi:MAG: tRNA-dihydrouridine synthase [Erysipelothrix sp.]|nr:tRNA-dihydrouridine synthase [Erysipelothrix sp.]
MKHNFWNDLPKPFFILAPMEDVTDVVFRKVVAHAAKPDVFFTEFTNSESYCHAIGKTTLRGRLTFEQDELPLVAHIWGDEPKYFEEMSIGLAKQGFSGIDLNMGCPAPNVFKHGRGAGLILRPNVASDIIKATKKGGLPVSVKTRLGHAKVEEWTAWIKHLLEQDLANISIHLRTKVEMSKYPAHYELIPDILKLRDEIAPNTLITVNGDIPNYEAGMKIVEETGVDGIMIGRGVFHNPWCFEKEPKVHSPLEHINLFRYHLDLYDKYVAIEPQLEKHLQRFYKIYVRNIFGGNQLRADLMHSKDSNKVREILDAFDFSVVRDFEDIN